MHLCFALFTHLHVKPKMAIDSLAFLRIIAKENMLTLLGAALLAPLVCVKPMLPDSISRFTVGTFGETAFPTLGMRH